MTPQLYFDKVLATNEDVSNALTSDINQMRYIYILAITGTRQEALQSGDASCDTKYV